MKPLYALILVLIYTTIVQSQVQSVIGNTGGSLEKDGLVIEFTLGETIINTFSNNRHVITQGFHQPDIKLSTATIAHKGNTFDVTVFPNPFQLEFIIALEGDEHPVRRIDLIDINGRVIYTERQSSIASNIKIDGSSYNPGIYFLQYRDASGYLIYSEKILKLQ